MATEQRLDLIDRNALIEDLCCSCPDAQQAACKLEPFCNSIRKIMDMPSVDAVEVVRCKDCKHAGINENHPSKPLLCFLTRMCGSVDPEWYCGKEKGKAMTTELKPCPFCGGNAKPRRFRSGIIKSTTVHYVECVVCRVRTPVELDIETAIEAWNRRAEDEV